MDMYNYFSYGRIVVNWKLHNFTKELLDINAVPHMPPLYSPDFRIKLSSYENIKWKFLASRNKSELALYLETAEEPSRRSILNNYIVNYDVKIRDQLHEKNLKRAHGKLRLDHYEDKLGKIINLRECLRPRSYLLCNNTIHVVVYLEIIKKRIGTDNVQNSILSNQYEKMFNSENYSDFVIVTSDDQEIHVHKNVLSVRSPVFEAMINSTMKEGNEKKVKIDDISGKALNELIRFIYSGKVKDIDNISTELLYAASKYDIQDLKPLCIESLALNISIDNVIETLIMSDLHQVKFLKNFCMDFIKWKYSELKESTSWKNLSHEALKEIFDFVMSPTNGKKEECTVITNIKRTQPQVILNRVP